MMVGPRGRSRRSSHGRWAAPGLALLLAACATPDAAPPAPPIAPAAAAAPAFGESSAGAYLAGRDAQSRHDLALASLYLLRALNSDPENVELLQRATISLALEGRLDEAEALAGRLGTFDEEATVPAMLMAERAAKHGDWAAAEAAVEHLPPRGINNYLSPLVKAWARVGLGDIDGALEALTALDPKAGLSALRDFNTGLINDLAGRDAAAETAYRATLAVPAGHTLRTIEVIAAFYRRTGHADEAEQLVGGLHQDHPDLPPTGLAGSHSLSAPAEGLAEAFFGASGTMRQGNAPDLALLFSQFALDLEPDFHLARLMAGDVLSTMDQYRVAIEAYRHIPESSPLYASAQLRIARNDEQIGETDQAARVLQSMIERKIVPVESLLALGDLYRRQQRWQDAVHAYDQALPLMQGNPQSEWPVFYARGVALERSNQWPRAEADLLHALELQPNEPQVLNYLGYSWVEQGTNLPRATEMIEKAVLMRPSDGFMIDSLGWAFYRSGEYGRAVELLQRAVTLVPGDATINDHLGDALWSAGRLEEARFQWQHALLSDPDPELRAQLDAKLKQ